MMYWDGHMTTAGWIVAILWTVILLVLIVAAIYWLARTLAGGGPTAAAAQGEPSARQILDRRLAAGEIGIEEHERLRAAIGEETGPSSPPPVGKPATA